MRNVRLGALAAFMTGVLTMPAGAAVLAEYDAGVEAAPGVSGAADPVSQGWTPVQIGSHIWSVGLDSLQGGWRVTDGTSDWQPRYTTALDASDTAAMDADGWSITWIVSRPKDAVRPGFTSVNFYSSNLTRDKAGLSIGRSGQYRYDLRLDASPNGDLLVNDGTTDHVMKTGTVVTDAFDTFFTLVLNYDAVTDSATLTLGSTVVNLASTGTVTDDEIVFGSLVRDNAGSAIYNLVRLESPPIPEPASLVLFAAGGFLMTVRGAR